MGVLTSNPSRSKARLVGVLVLLLIISLGELVALVLEYQNNSYLRQYVSANLSGTIEASLGLLALGAVAGYAVSRRLRGGERGPSAPTFSRIGLFVTRRHRLVVVLWILLLAVALPFSLQLSQVLSSSTGGGQSSSSESARADLLMTQEFPRPQSNSSAIVLLQGRDVTDNSTRYFTLHLEQRFLVPGVLNSVENFTSIYSLERTFYIGYFLRQGYNYSQSFFMANQTVWNQPISASPFPPTVIQNFISSDKTVMIITVSFTKSPGSFGSAESDPILQNVVTMRSVLSQLKAAYGGPSETYVTGDLATTADSSIESRADLSRIEPVTIAAILILVGLFFLAVVTPLVPLGIIGMGLLIAEGGLFFIGKYIIPIQDFATTFLFTIMLGVGTDYAIFLMARYREERVEGREKVQAVHTSITWSGESIATSASTVIIAFGVMLISSFTLLRSIGVSLSFGVLVALLVSLTLIPSIVLIAGDRVFWPTSGKRFDRYAERARRRRAERPGYFRRAAGLSVKRPVLVLGLALLVSLPAIYISATGLTTYDFTAGLTQAESVHAIGILEKSFGAGQIGPTQVLVQFPSTIIVDGHRSATANASLTKLSQGIANVSNVKQVTDPMVGRDNRTAMLTILFVQEPFSPTSLNTVSQIRNVITNLRTSDASLASDTILVGGVSAATLDFSNETVEQFNAMRIITVVAIFIVLLVVLGSYPLALIGILSIGLSITWAYAATLIFFNNFLGSDVLFIIPLILFLLLYGIGMDYNIFILTRIREESQKGKETHQAVVDAVDRTGGIITALALILAAALGSLLLSSNRLLQGFGFAIGLAVILDAMVVRTYIVPAGMSLLGRRAWWGPNWLRRVRFDKPDEPASTASQ